MLIHHNLCRNCLLQQVMEGKIKGEIKGTRRSGRRCRKLLDDFKERRGCCHLKEGALDRTMWRARVGGGFLPVVRQTTNEHSLINSVAHSMAHPQFWDRENNLQIWKVPAKIMNNRSQSADKG